MSLYEIVYWAGVVMEMAIRTPLQKAWKAAAKTKQHVTQVEKILLGLLWFGMIIIPLVFTATKWLDFANYQLPTWMGWLGVFLLACSLAIFIRAHMDLKSNWSPTLEIFAGHALVTGGIYQYIRHPMYASQWIWVIAQILLLQNWLAGPIDLIVFIPFYVLRVKAEEKMMLEEFWEEYRQYMQKTGGVIPKF